MTTVLNNLNPSLVFKYFEEISQIPRGSYNEEQISNYLYNFAKNLNLEVIQDEHLNIIIKKPATAGYENCPGVILQGHMDMVCEKNKDVKHDFEKDPIKLKIVDDMIYADGTTLGADNGIAVAMSLAILASNDVSHPNLEVLITSNEESGMTGAMGLDGSLLSGKYIINLDSEEEGYLLVSCAGGNRSYVTLPLTYKPIDENKEVLLIELKGLLGGHSGADIIKQRANSNVTMGRILNLLDVDYDLVEINGGSKNNAIPRECEAKIAIDKNQVDTLKNNISEIEKILKHEFKSTDSGLEIIVKEATADKVLNDDCKTKAILLLNLMPNGIQSMSMDIEGLVESSTNLGVLTTKDGVVEFDSAIRSSIPSLKEEIVLRSKTIVELLGGKFETTSDYPGWEYDPNSKVRDICQKVHKDMYGKEAKIVAIHAGVECGLFNEKLGNLDMISFGPNLYDVHTPDEHMSISSVKNCYEYLLGILKEIR